MQVQAVGFEYRSIRDHSSLTLSIGIKEVEVEWQHRDESTTKGKQGGKFFRESIEMAQEILNVIRNNFRGRYKKEYLVSSSTVEKQTD